LPESDLLGGHDGENVSRSGVAGGERAGGDLDDAIAA
jgi:hypothetical protein